MCEGPPFFFFFTSFLLFARLWKVINHTAPAGEGSYSSGPTLPPLGTSFESYNPFLDPHFFCLWKTKRRRALLTCPISCWCSYHHTGLGEERSLTNLDCWVSWNRSMNAWICVLYRGNETVSRTNVCWEKGWVIYWTFMLHFAGHWYTICSRNLLLFWLKVSSW